MRVGVETGKASDWRYCSLVLLNKVLWEMMITENLAVYYEPDADGKMLLEELIRQPEDVAALLQR